MTVDATALDRVRARLADAGADPTPTEVARALRRDGDLVGDAAVLEMVDALRLHGATWDAIERLTLDCGGSIAHHHGTGLFRGPYMRDELGEAGFGLLQAVKDALDPDNIMNPGKIVRL